MASEPTWLSESLIRALHAESLDRFGGTSGIRDRGLLESALGRPRNRHAYGEDVSIHELAAAYCFGIVRNHPFVDGNKRAGLLAVRAFLFQNDCRFVPDEAETVQVIEGLAASEVSEAELTAWIEQNTAPR
jgi:death-on-curing protein